VVAQRAPVESAEERRKQEGAQAAEAERAVQSSQRVRKRPDAFQAGACTDDSLFMRRRLLQAGTGTTFKNTCKKRVPREGGPKGGRMRSEAALRDSRPFLRLVANDDETLRDVALAHGRCSAESLLRWNRDVHPGLTLTSRLMAGTQLLTTIKVADGPAAGGGVGACGANVVGSASDSEEEGEGPDNRKRQRAEGGDGRNTGNGSARGIKRTFVNNGGGGSGGGGGCGCGGGCGGGGGGGGGSSSSSSSSSSWSSIRAGHERLCPPNSPERLLRRLVFLSTART
jgi:hypothetical protein